MRKYLQPIRQEEEYTVIQMDYLSNKPMHKAEDLGTVMQRITGIVILEKLRGRWSDREPELLKW